MNRGGRLSSRRDGERFQFAEEFAKRVRRLTPVTFVAGLRDQGTKTRAVEQRVCGGQGVERGRFGDQAIAPLFERMLPGRIDRMPMRPEVETPSYGFGIDIAHELADILELPFATAPRGDRTRGADGVDEPFGQIGVGSQFGKALGIELD